MEIEFGKWLLDIAKYLITAMLLASIFSDMSDIWCIIGVILLAVTTIGVGLYAIGKGEKKNKINKKR